MKTVGLSPGFRRGVSLLAILAAVLVFSRCATTAPGSDPVVVRADQALAGADALYSDAMAYYFLPGKAASLPPNVAAVFEKVRTGYDKPYQALEKALETYKAGKALAHASDASSLTTAVLLAENDLASLINQVVAILPASSATKSKAKPVVIGGN